MAQFQEKTVLVETIFGSFTSWRNDFVTDHLIKFSAHARNELSMLKSIIKPGDNIIDIGAHVGTFSIPFSRFNKGKGQIYSFEANPDNYMLLSKNINYNKLDSLISPIHAVVSSEENIEFSGFLPDKGNSGMYYFEKQAGNSEFKVKSVNIDKWYERLNKETQIHMIKIDVHTTRQKQKTKEFIA